MLGDPAIGIKLAELLVDQSEFQTDTETDTVHYVCVDDIDDDNQRATHTLFTHVEISRFLQDNFHINESQGNQLSDFILSRSSHGDSATFEELKQILGFSETTLMDAHDEVQRLLKRLYSLTF